MVMTAGDLLRTPEQGAYDKLWMGHFLYAAERAFVSQHSQDKAAADVVHAVRLAHTVLGGRKAVLWVAPTSNAAHQFEPFVGYFRTVDPFTNNLLIRSSAGVEWVQFCEVDVVSPNREPLVVATPVIELIADLPYPL